MAGTAEKRRFFKRGRLSKCAGSPKDEDYNEPSTQRRGVDRFLLVAILAVVIAVAAIAFGFWREARERQAEAEMLQMEQFDTRFE